jgi:hypothetical protein
MDFFSEITILSAFQDSVSGGRPLPIRLRLKPMMREMRTDMKSNSPLYCDKC